MRTSREMDEDGEDNPTKLVVNLAARIYGAIPRGSGVCKLVPRHRGFDW